MAASLSYARSGLTTLIEAPCFGNFSAILIFHRYRVRSDFQLSFDVGHGLTSATYTRTAVDQHWLLESMIRVPNVLQLLIGKRWMLVVANWNMDDAESAHAMVRNQIHSKTFVQS